MSFNDVVLGTNLSVAGRYLSLTSISIVISALIIAIASVFLSKKIITTKGNYVTLLLLIILILPFSFYSYINVLFGPNGKLAEGMNIASSKLNIMYMQWNWNDNVTYNGLPMHLIQTSVRKSIPNSTSEERLRYLQEKKSIFLSNAKHKTIIYILCEACWYNQKHFRDGFKPLIDEGYVELRATSPIYGGGTANAEFEMLTGLPSNSRKLTGIIYQEYSSAFKSHADTLPNSLKEKGYKTFAAHNFHKNFWNRDKVYNKFGFDNFFGLSDMDALPPEYASTKKAWQWQPDDYLLYSAALKAIKNSDSEKNFLSLITMSTHGPYQHINDYGEGVYTYQINEAIERLSQFSMQVEKIDPDAVIVVYADHKPALNKYFFENKVFPKNIFSKIGEEKDDDFVFKTNVTPVDFGDVPILIKSKDKEALQIMVNEANGKPFFCVTSLLDKYFIQSGLVSFNYNMEHVCGTKENVNYEELINMTPEWIYSMSLFQN